MFFLLFAISQIAFKRITGWLGTSHFIPSINLQKQCYTTYGGGTHWSDGSVYGDSDRNAVVQHQKDSSKYPTSGISTTPNYDNAASYAKGSKGTSEGYVYTIDTALLEKFNVAPYIVDEHANKPTKPEDNEVILVAEDFGCIPVGIISKKAAVT